MSSFDTQFDKLFKFYFLIVAVQYPQQTNKFIFNKIRKEKKLLLRGLSKRSINCQMQF